MPTTRLSLRRRCHLECLPNSLIVEVLLICDPLSRLTFVLCVCKWLRTSLLAEASLWQNLDVTAISDSHYLLTFSLLVDDAGLSRLLSLINPAFVRNFNVTGDLSSSSIQQAIEMLPMLRGLFLRMGHYSSNEEDQLIESVLAQPWVKHLERLNLYGFKRSGAVLELACAAANLEKLTLPNILNTEQHLTRLADIWRTAHDGHNPKLMELDVGDATQDEYACVGRLFPRLRALTCKLSASTRSLAPMTNLVTLFIHVVDPAPTPLELAAGLRALLTACPNLTELHLFSYRGVLPAIDNAFSSLPPPLEKLSVVGITLRASDFPKPLPLLQFALLMNCGAESVQLVAKLRERSPHLKRVYVTEADGGHELRQI